MCMYIYIYISYIYIYAYQSHVLSVPTKIQTGSGDSFPMSWMPRVFFCSPGISRDVVPSIFSCVCGLSWMCIVYHNHIHSYTDHIRMNWIISFWLLSNHPFLLGCPTYTLDLIVAPLETIKHTERKKREKDSAKCISKFSGQFHNFWICWA